MLAPEWTWWTSVPVILVAVALLWAPGLLLAAGFGAGRWPSVALAPVLTTSLFSMAGIAGGVVGVGWGVGALLVVGLVLPAVVVLLRLLAVRLGWSVPRLGAPPMPGREIVIGGVIAAGVAVLTTVRAVAQPGDFPQQPDAIYQLGMVRYFLDTGSVSSLTADGLNNPSDPTFYPAAFHVVAASVALLTHAPVIIVEQGVLLVSAALVWPLGVMFLVGSLFPGQRYVVLMAGTLASVLPAYPFKLWFWGPLWTLEFGFAHIPAVVAIVGLGLSRAFAGRSWAGAALLLAVALPGISLSHPGATYGAAVGAFAYAIGAGWRYAHDPGRSARTRWLPLGVLLAGGAAGFFLSTRIASPGMAETSYDRVDLVPALIGFASQGSHREDVYQVAGGVAFALVLLGVVTALANRRGIWLVVAWSAFAILGLLTSFLPGSATWPLTWPWYNLPVRVQAVAAIYGVPLAALGIAALLRRSEAGRLLWARIILGLGAAALVAVQILSNAAAVDRVYSLGGGYAWTTDEEAEALRELSRTLPDDAVVAANPWLGASYLYVVGPEETLVRTEKTSGPDVTLLAGGLDRVLTDPEVCSAVVRTGLTHVITGGDPHVTAGSRTGQYAGIDGVSTEEGFTVVDTAEPFTLWKVPDCRP